MRLRVFLLKHILTIEISKDDSPLLWIGRRAQEFQSRVYKLALSEARAGFLKISLIKAVRKVTVELGYPMPSLAAARRYVEGIWNHPIVLLETKSP